MTELIKKIALCAAAVVLANSADVSQVLGMPSEVCDIKNDKFYNTIARAMWKLLNAREPLPVDNDKYQVAAVNRRLLKINEYTVHAECFKCTLKDKRQVWIMFAAKKKGENPVVCIYKNIDGTFRELPDCESEESGDGTFYRMTSLPTMLVFASFRDAFEGSIMMCVHDGSPYGKILIPYFMHLDSDKLDPNREYVCDVKLS
jgi:hypothetical protein